jgi:hypothetical protein
LARLRGARKVYVETHGAFPHACAFCGELADVGPRYRPRSAVVHHVDEDRTNDDPANLAVAHWACHQRYHKTGNRFASVLRGRPLAQEHRAAIAAAARGNQHAKGTVWTPEMRQAVSERMRGNQHARRAA